MDFLKTLLLYMTVTFATTVQVAPTPVPTPVPTPTPIVTEAPTNTPAPPPFRTVLPGEDEPVPTLTPNPAYRTLGRGDRNENVKKLQERLIELGYLTGPADGSYGAKTQKAVRLFQYQNGLQQDGIAGKATQTVLFEDPYVIANPEDTTPTETPTPEPTVIPGPDEKSADELKADMAPVEGAVCMLNEGDAPLTCLRSEDGVLGESSPRIYADGGRVFVDLIDLTDAIADWQLTQAADGTWTMTAAGYTITIGTETDGVRMVSIDGSELEMDSTYLLEKDGRLYADADFLSMVLDADPVWDGEAGALTIRPLNDGAAE